MIRNERTLLMQALIISALAGMGSTLSSCSSKKTEETTTSSSTDTTAGFMGAQGDTMGSNPMSNQQAPPDSGSTGVGTTVGSVTVTPKNK